jgi:hypothetical protein
MAPSRVFGGCIVALFVRVRWGTFLALMNFRCTLFCLSKAIVLYRLEKCALTKKKEN